MHPARFGAKLSRFIDRGRQMDTLFGGAEQAGVAMYLLLFALIVFGGMAFYMGYKVLGVLLVGGVGALLAALVAGMIP
jgi:hypothetical protein